MFSGRASGQGQRGLTASGFGEEFCGISDRAAASHVFAFTGAFNAMNEI